MSNCLSLQTIEHLRFRDSLLIFTAIDIVVCAIDMLLSTVVLAILANFCIVASISLPSCTSRTGPKS